MKELGLHVETNSPQISTIMERILLVVLSLSGWLIPSTCLLRQYHYVTDFKTWSDAQSHCRRIYTDLATTENNEEVNQLKNTVSALGHSFDVWIGLYSEIRWRWSDGYSGAEYRKWKTSHDEPDFVSGDQFCVVIGDGGWWDDFCFREHQFICYRGTQLDPEYVVVKERMNWSSAQRYCRENFIDLATVRNDTENKKIQSLLPSGHRTWIGLARHPSLYWSDKSKYKFSYWANAKNPLGSMARVCGIASDLQTSGKWKVVSCDTRLPFVCYSIAPVQATVRQVVKLRIKGSSVDLNDPAVKADILKKLQDRLKVKATGVTLKWREQPDGQVFYKEATSYQKKQRKKTEL